MLVSTSRSTAVKFELAAWFSRSCCLGKNMQGVDLTRTGYGPNQEPEKGYPDSVHTHVNPPQAENFSWWPSMSISAMYGITFRILGWECCCMKVTIRLKRITWSPHLHVVKTLMPWRSDFKDDACTSLLLASLWIFICIIIRVNALAGRYRTHNREQATATKTLKWQAMKLRSNRDEILAIVTLNGEYERHITMAYLIPRAT